MDCRLQRINNTSSDIYVICWGVLGKLKQWVRKDEEANIFALFWGRNIAAAGRGGKPQGKISVRITSILAKTASSIHNMKPSAAVFSNFQYKMQKSAFTVVNTSRKWEGVAFIVLPSLLAGTSLMEVVFQIFYWYISHLCHAKGERARKKFRTCLILDLEGGW